MEKAILSSVEFPSVLSTSLVEWTSDSQYRATFDNGDEKLVKCFASLPKANDWLVSMTNSFKKGNLHRHMNQATREVKEQTAWQKAADACLTTAEKLPEALESASIPTKSSDEAVDVTASILRPSKVYTCTMAASQICVNRGTFNTFTKSASSTPKQVALLLGKQAWNGKLHVTNIVMGLEDLRLLVSSEAVAETCRIKDVKPCGFFVTGTWAQWRDQVPDLLDLLACEFPLFMGVDFSESMLGKHFHLERDTGKDIPALRRVYPSWTTQPRDTNRRFTYNICWETQLQVSRSGADKVCEAMIRQLTQDSLDSSASIQPSQQRKMQKYRRVRVPADGHCGWHCLLAARDIGRFEKVPRQSSGYASARKMVKHEEDAAKSLCESVCAQALKALDLLWHPHVLGVLGRGDFGPCDLQWISQVTGASIRCTCCSEAVVISFLEGVEPESQEKHVYIYRSCIYIHRYVAVLFLYKYDCHFFGVEPTREHMF